MEDKSKKVIDAIKLYQEPGSVGDFDENNFLQNGTGVEWSDHVAGSFIVPNVGLIYLGMPTGFNRFGRLDIKNFKLSIFTDWEQLNQCFKGYDQYNVPCWKYLNENGHTLVRGLSPRINHPFLHIILENCIDKINCLEIKEQDIKEMD